MLRLAAIALSGRRIMTIETDFDIAADMAHEIQKSGGIVAGAVPSLSAALAMIDNGVAVDCAMIDTALAAEGSGAGLDFLRHRGVEIVFVTGFDELYDVDEDEADAFPLFARA